MQKNVLADQECYQTIINQGVIDKISTLLSHKSNKILENSAATLLQLNTPDTYSKVFTSSNIERLKELTIEESTNPVLRNLANIFIETVEK